MVSTESHPEAVAPRRYPGRPTAIGTSQVRFLRTTGKDIGILYLVTSFVFFMVAGAMALLMRAELARPGQRFLSIEQDNQLFTMHGTIMPLLYATPLLCGFANYILPLQIGSLTLHLVERARAESHTGRRSPPDGTAHRDPAAS